MLVFVLLLETEKPVAEFYVATEKGTQLSKCGGQLCAFLFARKEVSFTAKPS